MPQFLNLLINQDLNFLEDLEAFWGLSFRSRDAHEKAQALALRLVDPAFLDELVQSLPQQALAALLRLKALGGLQRWSAWLRENGELRAMGPGKRRREKPGVFPQSLTEWLWYRGLIGRSFLKDGDDLEEFVFLPEELQKALPDTLPIEKEKISLSPLEAQAIEEHKQGSHILDDLCTYLSSLRRPDREAYLSMADLSAEGWQLIAALAEATGLTRKRLPTEIAKNFLELPSAEALRWFVQTWMHQTGFDELRQHPDWRAEGTWQNEPRKPRLKILKAFASLPSAWYSIDELIEAFKLVYPDFLRQGADYEVWRIQSLKTGALIRGVNSWDQLEGAFLRYFISKLLYRLGCLSLDDADRPVAFKISPWFGFLTGLGEGIAPEPTGQKAPILINPAGKLELQASTDRLARYQVSRFGEPLLNGPERFAYQLTPLSLKIASEQGLKPSHLIKLLRTYAAQPPSPAFLQLLGRWEENGRETWIDRPLVLHLAKPELLQALKASPAASALVEQIGPTTVILKPGSQARVQAALAKIGVLTDIEGNTDEHERH